MDWTGKTNADFLAAWDAGETVWTTKMTGGNDAHEHRVQNVAIEMLRELELIKAQGQFSFDVMDAAQPEVRNNLWATVALRVKFSAGVLAVMGQAETDDGQVSAALQLASRFARLGYDQGMETTTANRRVQFSKATLVI
jgi:hypothetical protein